MKKEKTTSKRTTTKTQRTFKDLRPDEKDMVTALAMFLSAGQASEQTVAYTSSDVCKRFNLKRTSYAAVQANITRRK